MVILFIIEFCMWSIMYSIFTIQDANKLKPKFESEYYYSAGTPKPLSPDYLIVSAIITIILLIIIIVILVQYTYKLRKAIFTLRKNSFRKIILYITIAILISIAAFFMSTAIAFMLNFAFYPRPISL